MFLLSCPLPQNRYRIESLHLPAHSMIAAVPRIGKKRRCIVEKPGGNFRRKTGMVMALNYV